jgi:hypothetical protein
MTKGKSTSLESKKFHLFHQEKTKASNKAKEKKTRPKQQSMWCASGIQSYLFADKQGGREKE